MGSYIKSFSLVLRHAAFVLLVPGLAATSALAGPDDMSDNMEAQADYTVPVGRSDLRPYATFSVNRYTIRMRDDGRHVMTWSLPRDLTGGRNVEIVLTERNLQRGDDDPIRLEGDKGRATCRGGDWDDLQCSVDFRDLNLDAAASDSYLERKYAGTPRAPAVKAVAATFRGDPIGDVATFPTDARCDGCSTGNGVWQVQYQSPAGQWVQAEMTLDRDTGSYVTSSASGVLSQVTYDGDTAQGRWRMGGSQGWFRFSFDGGHFEGQWGDGTSGQQPRGQWRGDRISR